MRVAPQMPPPPPNSETWRRHCVHTLKQSFSNVLAAYFFRLGISKVREIIFKSYRIVCRLGEVEALLDLHRCFEHSLVKPSRVYVVIGVTDVKDYTSNNITWDLSLRLRTHLTQNEYKKRVAFKCCCQSRLTHWQSIERRIFIFCLL